MVDPVKVFLLDDHEIVRRGVRDLVEAEPNLVVVGEATTEDEAVRRITACREVRSATPGRSARC